MTPGHNQKPRPKAALHQAVRNIAQCREILGLSLQAVEYLRYAAERVSPDDVQHARTPWCYERVDDLAHALFCEPRTIHRIEKALIERGLIEKHVMANGHRHAKRCRRTGALLWAHGISLAPILQRREELAALATSRADIERDYRAARQGVNNLRARLRVALARAAEYPALAELRDRMLAICDAAPARIVRTIHDLPSLTRVRATLMLAVDTLTEAQDALDTTAAKAGDNCCHAVEMSDASDTRVRHKYLTTSPRLYSCSDAGSPASTEQANDSASISDRKCSRRSNAGGRTGRKPEDRSVDGTIAPQMTARHLLSLAPDRWRDALGDMKHVDWTMIGFVASTRRAELDVSERAWQIGIERMGPRQAALCLAILDTNQGHPTTPVRSVGGAFVAMTRRADAGTLDLGPSIAWITARRAGVVPARTDA